MNRAKSDRYLRAKLMLKARGVELDVEALAGAMLEGERDALIVAYIEALARGAKK